VASKQKRIAILGGGQLARMLAEAAQSRKLEVFIQSNDEKCPAARAGFPISTRLSDLLGEMTDFVIFENEFLAFEQLKYFSKQTFIPRLPLMEELSEKLLQKKLLSSLHIPATEFLSPLENESIKAFVERSREHFKNEVVYKWSKYGYDGHGTLIINHLTTNEEILHFLKTAVDRKVDVFAEKQIKFQRELAMIGFHSWDGSFTHLPLVETYQKKGVCKMVLGPAISTAGFDPLLEEKAAAYLSNFCRELKFYGALAFELFLDEQGSLIVNEIAPRVHNSGHFSQHYSSESQFDLHIAACLGEKLEKPKTAEYFGMLNLLGPFERLGFKPTRSDLFSLRADNFETKFYWYDKEDLKTGRKMGHVNFSATTPEALHSCLDRLLKNEAEFWSEDR